MARINEKKINIACYDKTKLSIQYTIDVTQLTIHAELVDERINV